MDIPWIADGYSADSLWTARGKSVNTLRMAWPTDSPSTLHTEPSVGCPWTVRELPVSFSWTVRGLYIGCWISVGCSRTVCLSNHHGLSLGKNTRGQLMDSSRTVQDGQLADSPRIACLENRLELCMRRNICRHLIESPRKAHRPPAKN